MSMFNNMMAYSEVYEVLNLMENEYRKRVPQKVIDFFDDERMKEYKPEIRVDIPLEEQNLRRETVILLVILTINYWCDTEEEKQSFISELERNEQLKKELAEKYNPDNLFKNRKQNHIENLEQENTEIVEYKKQNFMQKIFQKIKKFLKK
ncbi:MAG: hypothetical protein ACLTBX_03745 [Clostridia bacterium]